MNFISKAESFAIVRKAISAELPDMDFWHEARDEAEQWEAVLGQTLDIIDDFEMGRKTLFEVVEALNELNLGQDLDRKVWNFLDYEVSRQRCESLERAAARRRISRKASTFNLGQLLAQIL